MISSDFVKGWQKEEHWEHRWAAKRDVKYFELRRRQRRSFLHDLHAAILTLVLGLAVGLRVVGKSEGALEG